MPEEAVEKLAEALDADDKRVGSRTKSFLMKVHEGSVALLAGVTGNAAYDAPISALGMLG